MSVPQPLSKVTIEPPASRYSRAVDPADLNSAHTLAVMAVPAGSFVLDIGAADGSVARALTARGCRVWAIEIDPDAARAAERVCERVVCGDVARVLGTELDETCRFDVVLALDVLEHLVDPAAVLAAARRFLTPHGRLIASIPNVTHGAVRLQLLSGAFTRTETGLLDDTHLHFFDRKGVRALIRQAGFVIWDELRTRRRLTDTEIAVEPDALPADAVRLATDGFDSETYQFFLVAVPATHAQARAESLLETLQRRSETLEDQYRQLEGYARNLEQALAEARGRLDAVDEPALRRRAEEEARGQLARQTAALERHLDHVTRLHAAALEDTARLRDAVAQAATLSRELADMRDAREAADRRAAAAQADAAAARQDARGTEQARANAILQLSELRRQAAQLRREVSLRDAHVSELRSAADTAAAQIATAQADAARLREEAAHHDRIVADLSARLEQRDLELETARQQCAGTAAELEDVRRIARYRLADAANGIVKRLPLVHRLLKRFVVSATHRHPR
jgi:2-polyprenyl-3-methyl-5-hydroxy-6-metoxy-1,4-benzoquinol methylase/chaperonin cofactor prefoldin